MKIILRKRALCKVWMLLSQLYLKKENIKKSLTFFPVRIYQLPPKLGEDLKSFWEYMVSDDYSVTETVCNAQYNYYKGVSFERSAQVS